MSSAPSQCTKIHCGYCNTECLLRNHEAFKRKASPEVNPEDKKDNTTQLITTFYSKKRKMM